jgi:DNA polymerase-1
MPTSAIDPAHVLFALDPDEPPSVTRLCKPAQSFPPDLLAWLGDAKRRVDQPAGSLGFIGILPDLDAALLDEPRRTRLKKLIEEDIGPTVPVLARIERRGAWIQVPHEYIDWDEFAHATQAMIHQHELVFLPLLGARDPYAPSPAAAVTVFRRACPLTSAELDACGGHPEDELARMKANGFRPAAALIGARRFNQMARVWLRPLCSGVTRLRGRLVPTTTGRWVTGRYNLQGLTKGGFVTGRLRTGMGPPPGHVLVVADYSAFEGRILGALSEDPLLLHASKGADFHEVMAQAIFGRTDETTMAQWKTALYGIAYGQGRRGFIRTHPEFSVEAASSAYDTVRGKLTRAMRYQGDVRSHFQPRKSPSVTVGGWRRRAPTWTKAFNTRLQGSAADIFRWCLRRLDQELAPLGAFIVHQCHDEVFVAALPDKVQEVQDVVRRVMEHDVLTAGLLPSGVPLFVKMQVRRSWAEGS